MPHRYRLLTAERVRLYPAFTFLAIVAVAVWNRVAGDGLHDAIRGWLGGDFLSFYTAGTFVAGGRPEALNDFAAQIEFQQRLLNRDVHDVSLWVSPPFLALLFVPFAHLPYAWAYVVFVAVGFAAMVVALKILRAELSSLPSPWYLMWIGLQFYPTLQWLLNGQTTMLWFALVVLTVVSLRRGEDLRAGAFLGCLVCKPVLAIGLVAALAAGRRWRVLCSAAVVAGACVALGLVLLPTPMLDYVFEAGRLVSVVREPGYPVVDLYGSFEVAMLLLDDVSRLGGTLVGVALIALLLGLIVRLWWGSAWKPGTRSWDFRMASTLALGLLVSPHLYGYDLALLLIPLFMVASHYDGEGPRVLPLDGGPLLVSTALVWALALLGPVLSLVQREITRELLGVAMAVQLGAVAIGGWAYRIAVLQNET